MNGWSSKSLVLGSGVTLGASATNTPVSHPYPITANGALNCVIKLTATGVTLATGITAKLQTAIGDDWVDSKTVAITANGSYYIKLNIEVAGDQTYLPLLNKGRLVVSTGAGDAATISAVEVLQEL